MQKRASRLLTLRETLINHADDLVKVLPSGEPEPFSALVGEVLASVEQLTHAASVLPKRLASHTIRPFHLLNLHQKTLIHHPPLGTLLFVGSGNLPLFSVLSRLAPALVSGNAVILTSQSSAAAYERLIDLCLEAGLPTGLVQYIHRSDGEFASLIEGKPNKIFCWGSSDTPHRVRILAAENHIPVQAEILPAHVAVILPDSDIDFASSALLSSLSESRGSNHPGEHYFIHERLVEPFFAQVRQKLDSLHSPLSQDAGIQKLMDRSTCTPFKAVTDLIHEINQNWASSRVSVFSKNLYLAHDIARQLHVPSALINEQPYSPSLAEVDPEEFVRTQKIRLPRLSIFHFKAPWWLPHSSFQFQTFRTYLDLYRRHLTARLRAIPLLLWNLIQMFKNERRL